jgi:hypothetical protein
MWAVALRTSQWPLVRLLSAVAALADVKLLMPRWLMVVSQTFASWNHIDRFVRQIEALRRAASQVGSEYYAGIQS